MSPFSPESAAADEASRLPFHAVQIDHVRRLCRAAAALERPLDLERLISAVLGRVWVRRAAVPDVPDGDRMFLAGKPLLDACLGIGGRRGKLVLQAIAQIDRGQLGVVAGAFAEAIPRARLPPWMTDVGTARVVRAFSAISPGDGEGVLLHAERGRNDGHMLATFIDDRLGGIAKWFHLLRVIDPLDPELTRECGPLASFREMDPELTCRRVRAAIERTDAELTLPMGDEFTVHRALALARVTPKADPLTVAAAS